MASENLDFGLNGPFLRIVIGKRFTGGGSGCLSKMPKAHRCLAWAPCVAPPLATHYNAFRRLLSNPKTEVANHDEPPGAAPYSAVENPS
jgi:hypothetical protein